jgi:hypothetical protein
MGKRGAVPGPWRSGELARAMTPSQSMAVGCGDGRVRHRQPRSVANSPPRFPFGCQGGRGQLLDPEGWGSADSLEHVRTVPPAPG